MSYHHMGGTLGRAAFTAFVASGLLGLSAAQAQSIDVTGKDRLSAETRSVQVRYGDLNLANAGGRDRLEQRIRWAVKQVCGGTPRGLFQRVDQAQCTAAASDDAMTQARRAAPALAAASPRPAG